MSLLTVEHLKKVYTTRFGGHSVEALRDVNFSVEQGEYVAIMGESGSGKTTLLNILAALDRPTAGEVFLNGKALTAGSAPAVTFALTEDDKPVEVYAYCNLHGLWMAKI